MPRLHHTAVPGPTGPDDALEPRALDPFDTSIRYEPEKVADARTTGDVELAVREAADSGTRLTVFGTGHGPLHNVSGGVLLRTDGLAGVQVEPAHRTARVGAGTSWDQVLAATAPFGLAGLCGSAPSVGVIGYLLGGGIGPLARTYGFAADHVRSLEVVTPADGLVTASPTQRPDLFWALRGGKGGYGVVTAATLDLFPLERFFGGGLYFASELTREVLCAVAEWAPTLPEYATASVALLRLPDLPAVPQPLRGRQVTHVRFASTEPSDRVERLLRPIRSIAAPLLDTIEVRPYGRIGEVHNDPTEPLSVMCGGLGLDSVDAHAIDALLGAAGPESAAPIAVVELRALGGELARQAAVPNAVGGREAAWNLFVSGAPVPALSLESRRASVREVLTAMTPWKSSVNLVNFIGRANDPGELADCWDPAQRDRLRVVRLAADPDQLIPFGEIDHVS